MPLATFTTIWNLTILLAIRNIWELEPSILHDIWLLVVVCKLWVLVCFVMFVAVAAVVAVVFVVIATV